MSLARYEQEHPFNAPTLEDIKEVHEDLKAFLLDCIADVPCEKNRTVIVHKDIHGKK